MDKIGSKKQMVRNIINEEEVLSWVKGEYILIEAQTGRGKSLLVRTTLKKVAEDKQRKILLLSSRNVLKEQSKKKIENNNGIIRLMNYQELEIRILYKLKIGYYDYIIVDECHYIFNDAPFNDRTDITWKWIKEQNNSIRIFMSATMGLYEDLFKSENINVDNIYKFEPNYDYVDNFYYFKNDNSVEILLNKIPAEEKAIYFTTAKKAFELSRKFDDAAFYCSKNNILHRFVTKNIEKEIVEEKSLSCRILCATSVMDVGINIKDKSFKHVIIDIIDLDTIVQMAGRRRIDDYNNIYEYDKINIYIKKQSVNNFAKYYKNIEPDLDQVDYLKKNGSIAFIRATQKVEKSKLIDLAITGEGDNQKIECEINEIMYKQFLKIKEVKIKYESEPDGFLKDLAKMFGKTIDDFICLDDGYYQQIIEELDVLLSNMVDKKIFNEEQQIIKEAILKVTNENLRGEKTMKITKINEIIKGINLPYVFESKNRIRIDNKYKRYWTLHKIDNK